ncbi:Uncharacterised protein [Yersinia enterocolitica]|uniref:Uncharacterized protein n=1 Tax=Yersinia enterocolitica TaxID=630 RepID=A0ABP1YG41_YEREN|nr:Uncharacterised protein [Yersinia enterocolitica]CQD73535.1 Uncharacterised protein [Yersinia enterocolitica]
MSDGIADKFKIDGGINLAHQMVFRHQFIEGDGFKVVLLWGGVFKHGGQSVFCTDLIRSKSRPKGQDFVSSLKRQPKLPFVILSFQTYFVVADNIRLGSLLLSWQLCLPEHSIAIVCKHFPSTAAHRELLEYQDNLSTFVQHG